ncbi:MAG: DNA-processing protein DprA [Clostridiaceae bacterium]|nr:DNA-processing protein DprA [Clostridiaceae bacterium]
MNQETEIKKLQQCLWLSYTLRQPGLDRKQIRAFLMEGKPLDSLLRFIPVSLGEWEQIQAANGANPSEFQAGTVFPAAWEPYRQMAETAWQNGIRACRLGDDDYPGRLSLADSCPLVLYYRGKAYQNLIRQLFCVTVIGTRNPTQYGKMVAERIVMDLVDAHTVIISGLARGIDALAHKTALSHQGMTLAAVAHGVDLVYPPEHRRLMEDIAETGAIVSEHPPGTGPRKPYFPARNRILSGLSDAVAIMEASRTSGTMITASFAGDQGRTVFAVPGSILSPQSQGCNQLIREGAEVLESADDILRLRSSVSLPRTTALIPKQKCRQAGRQTGVSLLSDQEKSWLHLMSGTPLTLPEIAAAAGKTVSEAAAWLSIQEVDGLVFCERGRYALTESAFFCI